MRTRQTSGKALTAFMAVTVAILAVFAVGRVGAAQVPPGCSANNFNISIININGQVDITNGAVVTFVTTVSQLPDPTTCNIVLSSNGLTFNCPDANGNPGGTKTILIPPFTVLPGGDQSPPFSVTFTNQCTINLNPGVRTAQVEVTDGGAVLQDNPLQDDPAAIIKTLSFNIYTPCIQVTKQCNGGPFLYGQPISFVGTVTNCGDRELDGVQVVDDQAGVLISGLVLQPGQGTNFSATYIPNGNLCGPFTNNVTATGIAPLTPPVNVIGTASAVCTIITTPCIKVSKTCPGSIVYGTTNYVVGGVVTNCGNVPLINVAVVDDNGTPTNAADDITVVIGSLPIGGTAPYLITNTVPAGCGPFTDIVIASGASQCGGGVSATNSCTTTVTSSPCIKVSKTCPGSIVYGTTSYVVGGMVTNCGNVPLINVAVVDDNGTPTNAADDIIVNLGTIPAGGTAVWSATNTVPVGCGPFTDIVIASGAGQCGGSVSATNFCTTIVTTAPAIAVVKICPPNPVQPGGLMVVTGTVTNTGNVPLINVVVTNIIGALGISRPVLGPITLAPGTGASFSDSYLVPLNSCGPYVDSFKAVGADICSGAIVTALDTRLCAGTNSPRIEVTKNCPAVPTAPGQITTIFGVVSNAGNITLNNVIVVDNEPSNNTVVLGPITLAPGQAVPYSNSYRLPQNSCTCVDTVTASGSDKCFGKTVTDSATAACPTATDARIRVTKTCPPLPVPLGEPLVYSGTVSNAGNITLTNVIVVDNQPSNNTPIFGPVTLAPGETAIFIGEFVVPMDICDTTISDTVTALGNNLCSGATVSASQSSLCPIQPTPRLVVTKNCPPEPVPPGGLLAYSGSVSNAGNITLANVMVFNDHPTNHTPLLGPITLAPGQFTNFSGSYYVCAECCPPYVDTITAAGAQICNGSNVTAAATAYCPGITTPKLSLAVDRPPVPVTQGELLIYSGSVSNAGDVALGDIIVTDDKNGFVTEIFALAPGETEDFIGYYIPTNCGPNLQTLVSATAWDVCTGDSVSNQVSASCLVICPTNPPDLNSPAVQGNQFGFSFSTVAGKSYTVQFTTTLWPANWQTLTNFIGDGSVVTISDTPLTDQQRFYRVLFQ